MGAGGRVRACGVAAVAGVVALALGGLAGCGAGPASTPVAPSVGPSKEAGPAASAVAIDPSRFSDLCASPDVAALSAALDLLPPGGPGFGGQVRIPLSGIDGRQPLEALPPDLAAMAHLATTGDLRPILYLQTDDEHAVFLAPGPLIPDEALPELLDRGAMVIANRPDTEDAASRVLGAVGLRARAVGAGQARVALVHGDPTSTGDGPRSYNAYWSLGERAWSIESGGTLDDLVRILEESLCPTG